MPKSASDRATIRHVTPQIATLTTKFNRFAPFGYRKFIAVGNRATAIKLLNNKITLLNPVPLNDTIRDALNDLGGVHYISCDLGHHMNIGLYLSSWPEAKALGVKGLDFKRPDIRWDYLYSIEDGNKKPEDVFDFADEIETIMFEGFITRAVAWYHKPSRTLITSDHLMNLPATEQYSPSSASQGLGSWAFSKVANPYSLFFRSLIYFIATVDYEMMRRDVKRVAEWPIERIVPCHGDVIEEAGLEAWKKCYKWFLQGPSKAGFLRARWDSWMGVMRRVGLGAW